MSQIKIIHTDPSITNVTDFLDQNGLSPAIFYNGRPTVFLNIEDENGKTNRQRIKAKYNAQEKEDNTSKTDAQLLIKVGTEVVIPQFAVNKETLVTQGNQVEETTKFTAFLANNLKNLLKNPQYQKIEPLNVTQGVTKQIYPEVTVWMWVRSLSPNDVGDEELKGEFVDISPFVQSITINVGKGGGGFQMVLTPLVCEPDEERGWVLKKDTISNYTSNSLKNSYSAQANLHFLEKDRVDNDLSLRRERFFFHNIINANDLVFIRFEPLEMERDSRINNKNKFVVGREDIPGKIYDMIGFVDSNNLIVNPQNTSVSINIVGKDLSKTIINDGAYVFPLEFATQIYANKQQDDKLLKRIFGRYEILSAFVERSIQYSLRFVMNQLANTGFVPNDLFESYGSRRSTFFRENSELKKQGILSTEINNQFKQDLINQGSIEANFNFIESLNKSIEARDLGIEETEMEGVWQIIRFVFDKNIANRRVVDSSISFEQGALINFFRKVCQEPFVEFFTDTYGDQFFFIVRRPPFTKQAFKALAGIGEEADTEREQSGNDSAQDENVFSPDPETGNQLIDNTKSSSELVIDVEEEDVITEQLFFDDVEVYSWYRIQPRSLYFGDEKVSLAIMPAVYFSEYVELYGSRPYDIQTNYQPFIPFEGDKKELSVSYYVRQAVEDLKYLIDIHSYLPFTRKGTIVINGDRRIKRGTTIRLKSTREIFYVDGVSNNYTINNNSIDRTTTLLVSRGMIEKYIDGINVDGVENKVSYFNVINTEIKESFDKKEIKTQLDNNNDGEEETVVESKFITNNLQNWKVNKDVFNFFVKRRQFAI